MKLKKLKAFTAAITLGLVSLTLAPLGGPAGLAQAAESSRPEHRPSDEGVWKDLPENATMVKDGETIKHPCAGRHLLYRSHVDATYVTRSQGELTVMTVSGMQVMPKDSTCMRLAPDADGTGKELSRLFVPKDPNLAFLGSPGRILWHAPAYQYPGWRPIWAGYGAFDPHHEWEVPTDFVGDVVQLELTDIKGPGDLEIFNYNPGWEKAQRHLSSRDKRRLTINVGGHGHVDWTFSKPGIYELTWVASGRHLDGTTEVSKPVKQYWLVGPDEEVGLPKGFTTGLNSINQTAEAQREAAGLSEPESDFPATPKEPVNPPVASDEEYDKAAKSEKLAEHPEDRVGSGSNYSTLKWKSGGKLTYNTFGADGTDFGEGPIIEVPDSNLHCAAETDPYLKDLRADNSPFLWVTPKQGSAEAPSLGIDTSSLDYSQIGAQGVQVDYSIKTIPAGGRMVVGLDEGQGLMPLVGGFTSYSGQVQLLKAQKLQTQFVFNKPGVYGYSVSFYVNLPNGTKKYDFNEARFVVGNKAINRYRQSLKTGLPLLPENDEITCATLPKATGANSKDFPKLPGKTDNSATPEPGASAEDPAQPTPVKPGTPKPTIEEPGKPSPTAENPTPGQPEPGTKPQPKPGVNPGNPATVEAPEIDPEKLNPADRAAFDLRKVWADAIPNHLVERGHMDLALGSLDDGPDVYLNDGENPAEVVRRPSKSFAIAVPEPTKVQAPANLEELSGFAEQVYALPQVQDERFPWVGFNTESLDTFFDQLPGSPVYVTLEDFVGPGRMVTGHTDLSGKIDRQLDSADKSVKITYNQASHDHQYFWFSKPGVYNMAFNYQWRGPSGQLENKKLVSTFLVGKDAIKIGSKAIEAQELPPAPVVEPAPEAPVVEPSPEKPAPSPVKPTPEAPVVPAPSQPTSEPTVEPKPGKDVDPVVTPETPVAPAPTVEPEKPQPAEPTVEPQPVKPAPTPVKPGPVQPEPVKPTPVAPKPTPVAPKPAPTPVKPAPVNPVKPVNPVVPSPVKPVVPAPVAPVNPVAPQPVKPAPAPVVPKPAPVAPAKPAPVAPAKPAPVAPKPAPVLPQPVPGDTGIASVELGRQIVNQDPRVLGPGFDRGNAQGPVRHGHGSLDPSLAAHAPSDGGASLVAATNKASQGSAVSSALAPGISGTSGAAATPEGTPEGAPEATAEKTPEVATPLENTPQTSEGTSEADTINAAAPQTDGGNAQIAWLPSILVGTGVAAFFIGGFLLIAAWRKKS
ncbi:hypothetical protein BSR28_01515 [Boudabousia liubingyangii]|uniref:choice-of-anchor M domain-containing protein n=1 Tax=Boudabousia liubingyangii TaxID=1921764 RepID=UPI000940074A|nr:choice-of-anchor M domain-containing protein [Boudabousia liubingyangii]OKL48407.1 hypothetical protein BSR28_01515 [Boudabousia liubingyangii]